MADSVFVEVAPVRERSGLLTKDLRIDLTGDPGNAGPDGENRGHMDDGSHGGHGQDARQSGTGKTIDVPPIYIVFNSIHTSSGNPTSVPLLRVDAQGIRGGNGAVGGRGGIGGSGATGTPSSCGSLTCDAGPGKGGNGGNSGKGGRGGNAGRGGNGADVYIVIPRLQWPKAIFAVQQPSAGAGLPGQPGTVGIPGHEGGGGFRCRWCNGRDPGTRGGYPSPLHLGIGAEAQSGKAGSLFWIDGTGLDLVSP